MQDIKINKTTALKIKPFDKEGFKVGKYFTDHMFVMDYEANHGWYNPRIIPYSPISLDPSAMCLHYGQISFEDIKAFRSENGDILLFRPDLSLASLNKSSKRILIPDIDEKFCLEAIKKLVSIERAWISKEKGSFLYLRPFIFANECSLDVNSSSSFTFVIICSPVSSTYKEALKPMDVLVQNKISRAINGGLGGSKTAGNYISTIMARNFARENSCDEVIWVDGVDKRYIEEMGNMNVFFAIDDEIVTPEVDEMVFDGVMRASAVELLEAWGYKVSSRKVTISEIEYAYSEGRLKEVFAVGDNDTVSSIASIKINAKVMTINGGEVGKIARRLNNNITGIQCGDIRDIMGWTIRV